MRDVRFPLGKTGRYHESGAMLQPRSAHPRSTTSNQFERAPTARNIMNTVIKSVARPTLSLPFGKDRPMPSRPAPAATLSKKELERIVHALLG